MIFFPGKDSWFSPQINPLSVFHIRQVLIDNSGLKTLFPLYNVQEIEKVFFRYVPPLHQANPFAYSYSSTLHTSYMNGMLDEGGEGCQKAEKQIAMPAHQVTNHH